MMFLKLEIEINQLTYRLRIYIGFITYLFKSHIIVKSESDRLGFFSCRSASNYISFFFFIVA